MAYTKENLLSKTENGLKYIAIETNDLSDWISTPNIVVDNEISLCISTTDRSKMGKLIDMLSRYNFYPDICTIAILMPEYDIFFIIKSNHIWA